MIISEISKKGKRVRVNFDDGSELILNYEIFLKNGLRINGELSENRFLSLKDENLKYEIKQSALNLLSRRLHSTRELRTKLMQKYHNPDFIDEILVYLTENRYLDDKHFAAEFIEEKAKSKQWGNKKISVELKRRGVNNSTADEEFIREHLGNTAGNLRTAAEKKLKTLTNRGIPEIKIKQKLISYLLSKGFNYDEIKEIADELLKDVTEEQ